MNKFILAVSTALLLGLSGGAKVLTNVCYTCTPLNIITIDSIDYRKNLTRVYCKIHGKPHTSLRFDSISQLTDIDGVDLKRWFQFEESGFIPLELDFAPMVKTRSFNFIITTPRYPISLSID